ncbi:hypothetical protein [Facklamia sp. P12955]|uniref:hypothetical protein n=1 Tax=Facklamia sp. P12955 TaxID=3421946 RepID=UPI003D164CD2
MRVPLPFELEEIALEDTLDNIDWYLNKVEEAYHFYNQNDKKTALHILREINKNLEREYHHYHLVRVRNNISKEKFKLFSDYSRAITKAFVKQNSKNSYRALSSNLYDVNVYLDSYKFLYTNREGDE